MNIYCDNPNDLILANYQLALDNSPIVDAVVKANIVESTAGGTITNATNASPIVITSAAHGLSNGDLVYINAVEGNRAANGLATVANVTTDTFEISGSTGDGAYIQGGKWYATVDGATAVALAYNSSKKQYRGTLSEDIPVICGSQYIVFIDTSYGDHWQISLVAVIRQQ